MINNPETGPIKNNKSKFTLSVSKSSLINEKILIGRNSKK